MVALAAVLHLALLLIGSTAQDIPSTEPPHHVTDQTTDIYTRYTRFGSVSCDGPKIRVEIGLGQLVAPVERYTLIDKMCKPVVGGSSITFEYGPTDCGTAFEGNETHWLLSNTVVNVDFQNPPMPGSILLHNHQRGTFRCAYPKTFSAPPVTFSAKLIDYEYPVNGLATSEITMGLFTDKGLTQPVNVTRKLKLNSTLYGILSRQAIGDTGTFIIPSECHAYSEYDPLLINPMLARGCWVQSSYHYESHTNDEYVFSFPVFGFLARGDKIKLQCTVFTCKNGHNEENCKLPTGTCDFGPVDPVIKTAPAAIVRRDDTNKRLRQDPPTSTVDASFSVADADDQDVDQTFSPAPTLAAVGADDTDDDSAPAVPAAIVRRRDTRRQRRVLGDDYDDFIGGQAVDKNFNPISTTDKVETPADYFDFVPGQAVDQNWSPIFSTVKVERTPADYFDFVPGQAVDQNWSPISMPVTRAADDFGEWDVKREHKVLFKKN